MYTNIITTISTITTCVVVVRRGTVMHFRLVGRTLTVRTVLLESHTSEEEGPINFQAFLSVGVGATLTTTELL